MCTGIELALMGASVAGNLIHANEVQDQQDAVVAAQNQQLQQFLQRNRDRSAEATALFEERREAVSEDAVKKTQADATQKRTEDLHQAVESAPAAAAPIKGTSATVIGDVFKNAKERETTRSKDRAGALAKTSGFGDLITQLGFDNADAGRKVASIGNLAASDANLLPALQDLAGAEASLNNQPGLFGQILSGVGTGAASYFGNRAGVR